MYAEDLEENEGGRRTAEGGRGEDERDGGEKKAIGGGFDGDREG